jgi:ABC-type multidrug transport system fused ATPase/permease subunit
MVGPLVCLNFRFFAANPEDDLSNLLTVARIIEWILRFIPSFCLGKALLYAQFIDSWAQIYAKPDLTVWSEEGVLIEVIFLLFQSVIYIWLAINIDKLSTNPRAVRSWKIFVSCITCANLCQKSQEGEEGEEEYAGDTDVLAEENRVALGGADEDVVVLRQLTKQYDSGKLAVKNVSLGIPAGQCFGLLGTNGAGACSLTCPVAHLYSLYTHQTEHYLFRVYVLNFVYVQARQP